MAAQPQDHMQAESMVQFDKAFAEALDLGLIRNAGDPEKPMGMKMTERGWRQLGYLLAHMHGTLSVHPDLVPEIKADELLLACRSALNVAASIRFGQNPFDGQHK